MVEALHVTVSVNTDELREWAGKHADAGHHGVAEVLYRAANEVESITEAHDRTERAAALREAADAIVRSDTAFPGMTIRDAVRETLARAERIERGE